MEVTNKYMVTKIGWRFLQYLTFIWILLKAKYWMCGNFWDNKISTSTSCTWNGIMKCKDLSKAKSCWTMASGKNIDI